MSPISLNDGVTPTRTLVLSKADSIEFDFGLPLFLKYSYNCMMVKHVIVKFLFLIVIFTSCNRELINQIRGEEKLNSFASIVADSVFNNEITKSPYWPERPSIQFLYSSLFGLDRNSVYLQGTDECKFFITQPTVVWGQKINEPVILYPGEKIDIQMAEFGNVQFVSSDKERSIELHSFTILAKLIEEQLPTSISLIQYKSLDDTASIFTKDSEIRMQLNNRGELIKAKVDSLVKANNISAKFESEMINYLWAKIFALKVEYFWLTRNYFPPGKVPQSRYADLVSFTNAIQSHDELKYYYSSLHDLMVFLTSSKGQITSIFNATSFHTFLATVKENFRGLVKDYLTADILYTALRNKVVGPDSVRKYSARDCHDKAYRLVLREISQNSKVSEKYASAEEGKFLLPFASKTPVSEDKLLDSYKGKLVLVDFWASWCIPCRRELPLMRDLKRQYFGKDIVFLTISIDKKTLEWQKANSIEKLPSEESFITSGSDSEFVFKGHRIATIPRYLLFDRDGLIIDDNAPSPGTNALREMIDKYLHE